jgi:hypothetical protein
MSENKGERIKQRIREEGGTWGHGGKVKKIERKGGCRAEVKMNKCGGERHRRKEPGELWSGLSPNGKRTENCKWEEVCLL